tara:strand:+ start:1083 stop:1577 length:495 start_codon:yes stop_codon:yes gene_type:complete
MNISKKKYTKFFIILFFLILFTYFLIDLFQKEKDKSLALEPISINLLTSVHPNLSWNFEPVIPKISIQPGEVTTIEYIVENLGEIEATGIATFAYFPEQFGNYITKLNCFCYDAQNLKPKEKDKFTLILLVDPEVTKNTKTKNVKEVTIQFTFFDYKEYKKQKS